MCRHAHEVQLDDGSTLVYDVLVLAPGLHNATLSAVKDGGVGGVCSAGELSRHLTAADAAELSGVIVYGDTLDAVTAMGTLSAQGVTLSETALHIAPPGPSGPGLDILLEVSITSHGAMLAIQSISTQHPLLHVTNWDTLRQEAIRLSAQFSERDTFW